MCWRYSVFFLTALFCSVALAERAPSTTAIEASRPTIAVTIVGDNSYPPYSFQEDGVFKGIYTDIIKTIASEMAADYHITLQPLPWKRALLKLKNGEVPFVYPPYMRKTERPYMDYSNALLNEHLVMFCHASLMTPPRVKFPQDFRGLSLGKNLGFLVGNDIKLAAKQGHFRLTTVNDASTAIRRIVDRKMDCYINDRLSVLYEIRRLQDTDANVQGALQEAYQFSREKAYLGVSQQHHLYPFTERFLTRFNAQLKKLKASGELDRIVRKYTE